MLQGLVNYYERLETTGEVAPPGYSEENISFAIVIARDGSIIDITDLRDHTGRKPKPRTLLVPESPSDRSGKKRVSAFLWDNSKYALGIGRNKDGVVFTPDQLQEFKRFHLEVLRSATDIQLIAFRAFVESWSPDAYTSQRYAEELPEAKIVVRLDGEDCFVHESVAAKNLWQKIIDRKPGAAFGICLVTGVEGRIARLHPDIGNVAGQRNVGPLTSFNEEAFESFGKSQGSNAPVSERAAHAYATSLNRLLSHKEGVDAKGRPLWTNRVQIGDATTVFWAEAAGGPQAAGRAKKAENLFLTLLAPPTDEQEVGKLQVLLGDMKQGRPLEEIDPDLCEHTKFFILGLSPNAARLSVRFFITNEFGRLARNIVRHFSDLRIEPTAWRNGRPPSAYVLALQIAPMRRNDRQIVADTKKVPSNISGEMLRAILDGGRYPQAVLTTILGRFGADRIVTPLRVALVKSSLVRAWRMSGLYPYGSLEETTLVALDPDHPSTGYQLGRLFALYERAQAACFDEINSTVTDKFYASASAAPAYVFPGLERGFRNHLSKIGKGRNLARWVTDPRGLRRSLESAVGRILLNFRKAYPHQLSIDEQGLFVLGYYHEKFRRRKGVSEAALSVELPNDINEGDQQ
jgi:CRISPR-associated protein Csd1